MAGTLYLVATPLGNLGDMTYRAVETLRSVRAVVSEDTRRGRVLLEHFGIGTPLVSMPAFREGEQAASLVSRLLAGDDLALISDAGTPGISDPGTKLAQEALAAGVKVVPIPGASAVVTALSASGLPTDRFHFVGFLARKGAARKRDLEALSRLEGTVVLYEAPNRLHETLLELASVFGERRAVVARELTKVHEELARGTLAALAARFSGEVKGEVTVLVEGAPEQAEGPLTGEELAAELERRLAQPGVSLKDLARELAEATGRSRKEVYNLALKVQAGKGK